jgi:4-hydroxy-4-methyl-2-oxoglutarate aldolase
MTALWQTDAELFALVKRELFVAAVGDVLDTLGFMHQFLDPRLKLVDAATIIIGRAMPVLEADYFVERQPGNNPLTDKPFGMLFEALDDLKRDEVYVCAGSTRPYALWGGLMTTRARVCGAAGAVVHGYHRDTNEILSLGFPVASYGAYAQDQGPRGKVLDWRVPIDVDGVQICPGDVVYGDRDGVLVVPGAAVEDAFVGAIEKVRGEQKVLTALQDGMTTAEAFRLYGVM